MLLVGLFFKGQAVFSIPANQNDLMPCIGQAGADPLHSLVKAQIIGDGEYDTHNGLFAKA